MNSVICRWEMLAARLQVLSGGYEQPFFSVSNRWRYDLVERTPGAAFLWDVAAGLGTNGGCRLAPRLEAAFDSGEAPAETIQQTQAGGLVA